MSESEKFYGLGYDIMVAPGHLAEVQWVDAHSLKKIMQADLDFRAACIIDPSLRSKEESELTLDSFWEKLTECAEGDFYFEISGSDARRLVELLKPVLGK